LCDLKRSFKAQTTVAKPLLAFGDLILLRSATPAKWIYPLHQNNNKFRLQITKIHFLLDFINSYFDIIAILYKFVGRLLHVPNSYHTMRNRLNNLSKQHSVINNFIAELRNVDIQSDSMRFRKNLERLGELMAYEISKTLAYELQTVETPLGEAEIYLLKQQPILATIMRAGLPMHQGMLNIFDKAQNAFVSAYRRHHKDGSFEISMEYVSCPDLMESTLIICDPMLATGSSMDVCINELLKHGEPAQIHVAVAIAAQDGIEHIQRMHPNVTLWVGAIDEELTAKSYIVPGLGDAGDLAFGAKAEEDL
jgi:uracil phosphoribosyltransferase